MKKNRFLFIFILLIALFLRFYQLNQFPPSLNWDEISHGYNAYSILKTGQDQWGNQAPIFNFRAYGDYPTTLNMYLTIPFVYFFGLNEWSVRLPSAILGFGLVILAFFLTQKLFDNKKLSYLVMFLCAISPWTLFTSRAVFQSTVAQFFILLGITLFLYNKKNLGAIMWALSAYAYHNTRIVAPLLFVVFIFIYFPKFWKNKKTLFAIFLFSLLIIPNILNLFVPSSRARGKWVFIINQNAINIIDENRNNSTLTPTLNRLVNNKYTYLASNITKNYTDFLNPYLLFFKGSGQYQFNIPNHGILYFITLPFFYLGIFKIILKIRHKNNLFLILWFLIGLIPAVITFGDFAILRGFTIIPIPLIFIAVGLLSLKKISFYTVLLIIIIQASLYINNYFTQYPKQYSQSWQYGYKEVVNYIKQNESSYDQILITKKYGEPHEFILFYLPYEPQQLLNNNIVWDFHANWYWVDQIDKYHFINDWEVKEKTKNITDKTLLITSPFNYNSNKNKLLKTINFKDNTPAFDIVEIYEN